MWFFLISLAWSSTLECEALGPSRLHYSTYDKSGGAMPGPNTVMHSAEWTRGERVLWSSQTAYLSDQTGESALKWRILHENPLRKRHGRTETRTRYLALAGLRGPGVHTVSLMRCKRVLQFNVP